MSAASPRDVGPALRDGVRPGDDAEVRRIVGSTGFFSPAEVDVAEELAREALARGQEASGYWFVFAEEAGRPVGYACHGPIAATEGSFDLYWIAVEQGRRRDGLGTALLRAAEERIRAVGGRRVWVETSSRDQYEPTRAFYLARGYVEHARLPDFYAPGDDKVILGKGVGSR